MNETNPAGEGRKPGAVPGDRDITLRRQTEEALRASEERLQYALEAGGAGAWELDLATGAAWCSRQHDAIFGYDRPRAEWSHQAFMEHVLPEDRPEAERNFQQFLADRADSLLECRIRRADGVAGWISVRARRVCDERGRPVKVIGLTRDITRRKATEEALRQSEESERRLRGQLTVLQAVTNELSKAASLDDLCRRAVELGRSRLGFDRMGLWFVGPDPRYLEGSYGTDEAGGVRDEHGGRAWLATKTILTDVLRARKPLALREDTPLWNHDRSVVGTGQAAAAALWNGEEIIGCLVTDNLLTHRALSESDCEVLMLYASALGHLCTRQRAQEALRRSEEQYRLLVESSAEIILTIDEEGRFLFVNGTAASTLGFSQEEAPSKTLWDVFPKDQADARMESIKEVLRTGRSKFVDQHTEIRGREGWFRTQMQPLKAPPGERARVLVVAQNVTDAHRAQEALRRSEELYRTVVESAGAAICQYDEDGVCHFMNALGAHWLGLHPAQATGKTMWDLFPKDYADGQMEVIRQVLREGKGTMVEVPSVTAGVRRWFRVNVEPLRAPAGEKPRALVFARDVTQGHEIQEALEQARRRLQSIVENSWDVIFQIDLEGRYTYGNPAAERTTGYPLKELIGMSLFQLVAPEYHGLMRERLRRRAAGEELPQPFRFETIRRDGTRAWVELVTSPVMEGSSLVGVQGIARDITDRIRAEQELQAARERVEHLIAVSPAAMYTCLPTEQNPVTFVSNRIAELTGYEPREFLEDPGFWIAHLHPEDAPRILAGLPTVCQKGRDSREYRFRHKDGSWRWLHEEMVLVRDDADQPKEIVGYCADITPRKEAEEALKAAHAQLVRAREDERKRLAGELHDSLGQELISLHLRMQSLVPDLVPRVDKKQAAELELLLQRCQGIIREVRDISHGLYPPLLESVGLAAALREMASRLTSPFPIRVDYSPAVDKLRWPPEVEIALFRIAQEALGNAVRHSQATRVKLSLEYKQRRAILSIRDDGVGFDPEEKAAGLGLATMRDRAETVGGEFRVESRPGSTHVEVRVPGEASRRE